MTQPARALASPRSPAPPGVPVPRLSDADLRRGFDAVLSEREPGAGLWMFAYGALLWERDFAWDEERVAGLPGLDVRYCLWDERNRGTPERRSFTLGLRPGGGCAGAALHLAESGVEENAWKVWRHEMPPGYYRARWVPVETEAGPVRALTFEADPDHPLHAGDVPEAELAAVLASTSGEGGTAAEYLINTVEALRERGVPNPYLERLHEAVAPRVRAI